MTSQNSPSQLIHPHRHRRESIVQYIFLWKAKAHLAETIKLSDELKTSYSFCIHTISLFIQTKWQAPYKGEIWQYELCVCARVQCVPFSVVICSTGGTSCATGDDKNSMLSILGLFKDQTKGNGENKQTLTLLYGYLMKVQPFAFNFLNNINWLVQHKQGTLGKQSINW